MKLETSSPQPTKALKHILVYNDLFAKINNSTYPDGTTLPTEPELASQMNVSRMTLRRALALLQEDGLIENVRGVGNFVRAHGAPTPPAKKGIQHPFISSCTKMPDTIEMAFRIEPPTPSITQSLQRECAAVVIVDRWYIENGKVFGYTLSIMPIEIVADYGITLANPEAFQAFLQTGLYEHSTRGTCIYTYTTTGNFTSGKYPLSESDAFVLMQGVLYNNRDEILIVNKHYLPVQDFRLSFEATGSERGGSDVTFHSNATE